MIDIKHPSYRIYTSSANCKYEVYIDDILVNQFKPDDNKFGTGTTGEIYINPTILKNGRHTFKGILYPWHDKKVVDKKSYLELRSYIMDTDNFPKQVDLTTMETPWGGLDKGINYPSYELKGEFKATMLPFKLEGWSKSMNLAKAKKKKLFKEVLAYYRQLHAILKRRDAVKWEQLHQEKEALIAKAFYYDYRLNELKDPVFKKMMEDRKNATVGLFKEKGLELVPLDPANLKLLIQAEGQLVSLVRRGPAIQRSQKRRSGRNGGAPAAQRTNRRVKYYLMKRKDFIYQCASASLGLALPGLATRCNTPDAPQLLSLIGRPLAALGDKAAGSDTGFSVTCLSEERYTLEFAARSVAMYAENGTIAGYTLSLDGDERAREHLTKAYGRPTSRQVNDLGKAYRWEAPELSRSLAMGNPELLGPGYPVIYSCFATDSRLIVF